MFHVRQARKDPSRYHGSFFVVGLLEGAVCNSRMMHGNGDGETVCWSGVSEAGRTDGVRHLNSLAP